MAPLVSTHPQVLAEQKCPNSLLTLTHTSLLIGQQLTPSPLPCTPLWATWRNLGPMSGCLDRSPSICDWIKDFLTVRPQTAMVGPFSSSTRSLSTGWQPNIVRQYVFKKAQQQLHFLWLLRERHLEASLLRTFYTTTVESILSFCTAGDRRALQQVIKAAQHTIGCPLPSLEEIATSYGLSRVQRIYVDQSHPGQGLFCLLPTGKRFRSHRCRTNRTCRRSDSWMHMWPPQVPNPRQSTFYLITAASTVSPALLCNPSTLLCIYTYPCNFHFNYTDMSVCIFLDVLFLCF